MNEETITVYVTKYALSGKCPTILKREVKRMHPTSEFVQQSFLSPILRLGRDAFLTIGEARKDVADRKARKARKVESVRKQLARLEKIDPVTMPVEFRPDGGVSFEPVACEGTEWERPNTPCGTNLLTAARSGRAN